jgi:hypothetical protein
MQPVWDEYLETAAAGGNPFNVVDYVKPDDISAEQAQRPPRAHRHDPGRARRRRRPVEVAMMDADSTARPSPAARRSTRSAGT